MRIFSYTLPLALLVSFSVAHAQTDRVIGVVVDTSGSGVGGASVEIKDGRGLTQTDTIGHFHTAVDAGTEIKVTAVGFREASFIIVKDTTLLITLQPSVHSLSKVIVSKKHNGVDKDSLVQKQNDQEVMGNNFNNLVRDVNGASSMSMFSGGGGQASGFTSGALIPVMNSKEETRGSRYMFDKWVPGQVVNQNSQPVQNNSYLFNYDKIAGNLLLTQDLKHYVTIDKSQIKSFELRNGDDTYQYERVAAINDNVFFQVLAKGNKYCLYKMTTTKFEKANYVSNGLTESGHNYDQYSDENTYFLVDVKANEAKEITIRKKTLRELFAADEQKLHKYFSQHADDDVDLNYVTGLVDFLNN